MGGDSGSSPTPRPGEIARHSRCTCRSIAIRSGRQTITVIVPDKPARGGIDPYNLLDWEEGDNIEEVTVQSPSKKTN